MSDDDKTVFQVKPQGSLRQGVRLNGMFDIESLIAEGGMGEVYKGVAVASGDAVAIKLVRPEMSRDPDVMALFRREAAVLHDLLHDAIVRYYVFSLEPELQRYYIAMEFVDGVSLQKRLMEGALSPSDARILLRRIGGALEQAHERGVIHRDISSDNIILPAGDVRKAKIVDFGIARASRPGEGTILGGGFAGKYKYVSPEQLGLYGGEVTPKSDIYSFGLVIAEALRGTPLDMGGSQADVIEKRRKVPDLSGIDMSLRPLLTAMLSPDPADRPENMAEIAAWGESATQIRPQPPAPPTTPAPESRKGGFALVGVGAAVVVLAGLGGGLFAFRDQLGFGGATPPTPTTAATVIPPLPPATTLAVATPTAVSTPTPTITTPSPTQVALATPTSTPTVAPTPSPQGSIVTADTLLKEMTPKPERAEQTLEPATVGDAYRFAMAGFSDPTGEGLTLHASAKPPAGLAFKDLGGGRSELAGAPTVSGPAAFEVVAVTKYGKSARMKVAIMVNPRPVETVTAALSSVDLQAATAGVAYSAGLPPFRSSARVSLRAGAGLPPGLTLNDLGNGLSQLTGEPKTAGDYAFDVVAATASGVEGRMQVKLTVIRPPVVETPAPPTASPSPTPTSTGVATIETPSLTPAAFLTTYAGKPCFAARRSDGDATGGAITVIGPDPAAFKRFGDDFEYAVKVRPELRGLVVGPNQCAAVDYLKATSTSAHGIPKITLDSPLIGATRPLSGSVSGLSGRPLLLLVVDDDGKVFRLRTTAASGGDTATFYAKFAGDPSSFGKPQMLLAVAADKAIGAGQTISDVASAELLPKLAAEGREAQAVAGVALFKFAE